MLKKLLAVALAVLATLMIVGCQQPDNSSHAPSLNGLNLHGIPVSTDYFHLGSSSASDCYVFVKHEYGFRPDDYKDRYGTPTLSFYNPTNKTVTILVYRKNIGYCYGIYNADESGKIKPIQLTNGHKIPSDPISSYALCYADPDIDGEPYLWCASSDSGTAYGGEIREILYAVNIIKDNYLPHFDVALTGFAAGYQAADNKFRFFTNIFRYFDSDNALDVGFLSNQLRKGKDTFAPPEGLVEKISTIAAYEWTVYKDAVPRTENISNMAKRMDGIVPIFETEE